MPDSTLYEGKVYDIGNVVPNYVENVEVPHIWYDQSRSYKGQTNIFNELMISEGMLLGDSEDDMWTIEEILEEILKYLNLHIVQHGFDYYIFDWETSRTHTQITWLDIFTGETLTENYNIVNVPVTLYGGADTQLTIADVYNQISVKDNITEIEDVIFSPFDSSQLKDITSPQKYMVEYCSPGEGEGARSAFISMITKGGLPDTNYGKGDSAYRKQWMMKLKKSSYWEFLKNNTSIYDYINVDGSGKYYDQWTLPKYLDETPFASGLISFASGNEYNKENTQNIENINKFEDYIVINVAGNGADEQSINTKAQYGFLPPVPTQFPTENDLRNCGLNIYYNYTTDGTYSSADPNVMNYLVFSGKIMMTIARQTTGFKGFLNLGVGSSDMLNNITNIANNPNKGGNYVDWAVFNRKNNKFSDFPASSDLSNEQWITLAKRTVPSSKNDDGAYYGLLFYKNNYSTSDDYADKTFNNLMPPMDNGEMGKRFKYSIDKNSYLYDSMKNAYDIISYVDILACQLQIGDKFCEEYVTKRTGEGGETYAYKNFRWVTAQDLMSRGAGVGYDYLPDGTIKYHAYINIAININNGQFLVGEDHEIYNNIETNMGLDKTGMAIPLPNEDNLSGELKFSIVGVVNLSWDNGIRRHSTWFRHTSVTSNVVSVMPHVDKIWLKQFNVDIVSDKGKNIKFEDSDIVYRSDEQRTYINKKDDIEFNFTTALTAAEANKMHVNITQNKSDVTDTNGALITELTNVNTSETDKPEKIYVDAYYKEYCEPRTILTTTLNDTTDVKPFNKYNISFMNKVYYFVSEEKNVREAKTNVTLKERFNIN